ncbi:MAG TPA: zf-HC2 domain-containing protein, partial [Thermomicrobiales bacterium]
MTIEECAQIEETLSAMQDGAATPEERARAERHIVGCARCQATTAAFGQVDRQVRRYLMATPVPEIGTPWRAEPLVLLQRRGTKLGHWRVTAVGLAAIFVMLLTASILTFRPFANSQPQSAGSARSTAAADTGGGAPAAAPAASSAPA